MSAPHPADPATIELAIRLFQMARTGQTAALAGCLDGGADPSAGQPTALDTARMFGRVDYLALLESWRVDPGG